jgi:hypothetical protein
LAPAHADNERGYNGMSGAPVQIEVVDHTTGPAVILGALRQDGRVINADGKGVLVVETAILKEGETQTVQSLRRGLGRGCRRCGRHSGISDHFASDTLAVRALRHDFGVRREMRATRADDNVLVAYPQALGRSFAEVEMSES